MILTEAAEKSAIDTLGYTATSLAGIFELMNAWADPERKFMNDHARYDANMILAEVYARLAYVHQEVHKTLNGEAGGTMQRTLQEELKAVQHQIEIAKANLARINGITPTTVKAGKREVIL